MPRIDVRQRTVWASLAVLLTSIVALAAALLVTVDQASFHFRRGALAQAQFATVLRIEMLAGMGDGQALTKTFASYRTLIDEETELLSGADRAGQTREMQRAAVLADLAAGAAGRDARHRIQAIVASVVDRERSEAVEEARAMSALRQRTAWLAASLAAVAIGSALLGGMGLLAANRRLTREVERRTADIAAVDASRRLFFAKASHELRTPVTVMRGEAEVALGQPGSERDALKHVVAQTEFLDHRIGELLALAQAEDGRLRLEPTSIDLSAVVAAAAHAVEGYARSNDVAIVIAGTDAAPIPVDGDARWLEQGIVAVLDNAVKFSPTGDMVEMVLSRSGGCATLSIADRGTGMMSAALPHVFDAYYQTDAGRMRGGSGLGLALARWVVEEHGGSIAAANRAEGGGVITMTLPTAA